jgi:hypothetical protein
MPEPAHLEMIQAVISRLANNSFAYKGWAITVSAALVAFLLDKHPSMIVSALYPIGAFWILDAHSLSLERNYRELYSKAYRDEIPAYHMHLGSIRHSLHDWLKASASGTLLLYYGSMLTFILLIVRWVA